MATQAELEAELAAAYTTRKAIIESGVRTIAYPEHSATQLGLRELTLVIKDLEARIHIMGGGTQFGRATTRRP